MNDNTQLINSIGNIAIFLAAFPALWISGRIVLRNLPPDSRTTQFFLWLALGGLILTPLTDFLRYLSSIINFLLPQTGPAPNMNVVLGMGPYPIYAGLTLILGVAVYALALATARPIVAQGKFPILQRVQLHN
jgi:hypothetical protein